MSTSSYEELPSILDFRSIKRALAEVQAGLDSGPDEDTIREVLDQLGSDPDREGFENWYKYLNPDVARHIAEHLIREKKQFVIEDNIGNKKKYIEGVLSEASPQIAEALNLNEVLFYNSFFRFADRTSSIHEIEEVEGLFKQIADSADNASEAEEIFTDFVSNNEKIDDIYLDAVGELASPIIGEVEYSPKPRLVHFYDEGYVYFEFWKVGEKITKFDVNESDYRTIQTRSRTAVRVHIESGIIEYCSDEDSDDVKSAILDEVISNFSHSDPGKLTDGGSVSLRKDLYDSVTISDDDIKTVNNHIGVMSTLDTFHGRHTNLSVHSKDDKPTEQDRLHDQLKKRGYIKSHPKLLFGLKDGDYEPLDPAEVYDDYSLESDGSVPSIQELIDEIEQNSNYEKVEKFTVVLNADEDTLRIWKAALQPEVRRKVFQLIADELDW